MKREYFVGIVYRTGEVIWEHLVIRAKTVADARQWLAQSLFGVNHQFNLYVKTQEGFEEATE